MLSALVEQQVLEGTLVRLFDVEQRSDRAYYLVTATGPARLAEVETLVAWLRSTRERG